MMLGSAFNLFRHYFLVLRDGKRHERALPDYFRKASLLLIGPQLHRSRFDVVRYRDRAGRFGWCTYGFSGFLLIHGLKLVRAELCVESDSIEPPAFLYELGRSIYPKYEFPPRGKIYPAKSTGFACSVRRTWSTRIEGQRASRFYFVWIDGKRIAGTI